MYVNQSSKLLAPFLDGSVTPSHIPNDWESSSFGMGPGTEDLGSCALLLGPYAPVNLNGTLGVNHRYIYCFEPLAIPHKSIT